MINNTNAKINFTFNYWENNIKFLIAKGLSRTSSPLKIAIEIGNIELVKKLLAFGANINYQLRHNYSTPMHIAIFRKKEDLIFLFLKLGKVDFFS